MIKVAGVPGHERVAGFGDRHRVARRTVSAWGSPSDVDGTMLVCRPKLERSMVTIFFIAS